MQILFENVIESQFSFLKKHNKLKKFYNKQANEEEMKNFLLDLTYALKKKFNKNVIVLIDEFDASLHKLVFILKKYEEAKKV